MLQSIVHLSRLARAGWALTREGAFALMDPTDLPGPPAFAVRTGKLFGKVCTPDNPMGSCMVSSEGACAAYYSYGRLDALQRAAEQEAVAP